MGLSEPVAGVADAVITAVAELVDELLERKVPS
jgi:hypothetical protein